MILDVQRRLELAFAEVLLADDSVRSIADTRVWRFGDGSHRAAYPCVLMNTVSSMPAGKTETGWYEYRFQLLGSVFRADDKSKDTMRALVGALCGVAQRTTLPADLTATLSARHRASALTVVNVRIDGDVQDEEGDAGQIYSGVTLAVVCAPFNANIIRPVPMDAGGDSSSASGSASDSATESAQTPPL